MVVAARSPHLNPQSYGLHVHGYTWHFTARIMHLLALLLLYITNLRVLARHCRTSTLAANLERHAHILHGDFDFMVVARHACQQ